MVNDPFRALSHPIRRGIVERLGTGSDDGRRGNVGFGVSKPAISKHLKVLEETGVRARASSRAGRIGSPGARRACSVAADWMDRTASPVGRACSTWSTSTSRGGVPPNEHAPVVSPQEWKAAREELLVKEKEMTRARDALAAERRRMPRIADREGVRVRRSGRPGEPGRPVRGPPPADRLPVLLRARRATAGRSVAAAAARSWPTRSRTSRT